MIWILIAGVLTFLLWYYYNLTFNHFTRMGVKQTKPWPFLGDSWRTVLKQFGVGDMVSYIYNMYPEARYSGMYQFGIPTLVLRDPELIKQITVKDFDHFTDHLSFIDPDADPIWGGNLFSLTGQKWREMRATLSGSFTSSKMKHMFGIINEAAETFVQFFLDKKDDLIELEMKDTYTRFTNDVIASAAFGISVNSLQHPDNDFYVMGKKLTSFSGFWTRIKFVFFFVLPSVAKKMKLGIFSKELIKFFRGIIHETIKVREDQGIIRLDMINLLLETRKGVKNDETGVVETGYSTVQESDHSDKYKFKQLKMLSDDDITSQALIFFFAGFETISTALCFGSYELATNKNVQDKLRREIKEVDKTNNGKLTYESLLKMKYLDMVFSEILRKWPAAVVMDRVCTKTYTIEPVYPDEVPIHLKPGDLLWLPMHGIHRDDKYYPEPEKFDPERFSDDNKDSIVPYSYIPFGSGPRNCIGSRFAILEAKVVLYHLLLNFEIVPTTNTRIPLKLDPKSMQHTIEGGFVLGLKRAS